MAELLDEKLGALLPPDEPPRRRLRPPGALPEAEFLSTCLHSGDCVEACPVRAIKIWPADGSAATGTPFIEPNVQACVVCETIACTKVCPSGALVPLSRVDQIHLGLAEMKYETCVRANGAECRICVEKCPVTGAIRVGDNGRIEVLSACVGCGVCEMYCPTTPKAIAVRPA
jgi:MauM/NapG family ferredoxin protein